MRWLSIEAKPKPSAAIGLINGEISMAPITTAVELCNRPRMAMPADRAHIRT